MIFVLKHVQFIVYEVSEIFYVWKSMSRTIISKIRSYNIFCYVFIRTYFVRRYDNQYEVLEKKVVCMWLYSLN